MTPKTHTPPPVPLYSHTVERMEELKNWRNRARKRYRIADRELRRWSVAYYVVGGTAVVAAAVAGVAGLADLITNQVAGVIAACSAVLGAVDKWLAAGGKVSTLTETTQNLKAMSFKLDCNVEDAQSKLAGLLAVGDPIQRKGEEELVVDWLGRKAGDAERFFEAIDAGLDPFAQRQG